MTPSHNTVHEAHALAATDAAQSDWAMLIDGLLVPARSGAVYAGVDPTTELALPNVPDSSEVDVEAAFGAAHRAADGWAATPATERGRLVR
jgi:acyl-CoA reductase-like NAD-dependent aldehyde dehydrogenase